VLKEGCLSHPSCTHLMILLYDCVQVRYKSNFK